MALYKCCIIIIIIIIIILNIDSNVRHTAIQLTGQAAPQLIVVRLRCVSPEFKVAFVEQP